MKFATLFAAVAATLSTTVSAMPITDTAVGTSYVEARSDTAAGLFKRDEYCGTSTFKKETGPNSPKLDDCKRLMEDMRTYKTWTVNKGNNQRLAKYGNCRFVVDSVANNVKIGNFDIHDLVRDSIARYGEDGKVGAGGVMHCVAKGQGTDSIVWRVRT